MLARHHDAQGARRYTRTGTPTGPTRSRALARFRCNAGRDRHGPMAVFRVIPTTVRTADEMGLSREVQNLCYLTKGLVLVTGPTGSGKSTTLAALVDLVNRTRTDHIITIEDPIEFVHQSKKCLVTQRQVGLHTRSLQARAARGAARGPRHHPGGRDARPGDRRHRHRDRGDGAPGVRHAAHHHGRVHHRPDHRPVPGRPAVAGPGHALGVAARRHRADALQEDRRRPGGRAGGPAVHSGGLEPDPRGQDLPDPVDHADQPEDRHDHAERRPDRAGGRQAGRAEGGLHEGGRQGRLRRGCSRPSGTTSRSWERRDGAWRRPSVLVLVNPQDIVNIASAVRIARNFGIERMRLVQPEVFDPWRIEGIAHNTRRLRARIEISTRWRRPWPTASLPRC